MKKINVKIVYDPNDPSVIGFDVDGSGYWFDELSFIGHLKEYIESRDRVDHNMQSIIRHLCANKDIFNQEDFTREMMSKSLENLVEVF